MGGWANMDMFGNGGSTSSATQLPNDFAEPQMAEIIGA